MEEPKPPTETGSQHAASCASPPASPPPPPPPFPDGATASPPVSPEDSSPLPHAPSDAASPSAPTATPQPTTNTARPRFHEDKPVIGRQRRAQPTKPVPSRSGRTDPNVTPPATARSAFATSNPNTNANNVWNKTKEALKTQERLNQQTPTVYADEEQFADLYACAREQYNTRSHGKQQPMTQLEKRTLLEFRKGSIHLNGLPGFMQETHTLKERMAWQRVYRTHMRYRLYVETPPSVRLPMESPTWHLFQKIISKNQDNGAPSALVVRLMSDASVVNCSPESNLVELTFDRPETRARWVNASIAFPFGTITLRAMDAFTREDTSLGYDTAAMRLMYEVHLLGFRHAQPELVLAVADELGNGISVLDVEPVEPAGERRFDPHVWKITYESLTAPTGIDKLRCLMLTDGTSESKVGVHHPRVTRMHPCSKCLGLGHRKAKCTAGDNAEELRAPFTKRLNISLAPLRDMVLPEVTLAALTEQATRIRQQLEPKLTKEMAKGTANKGKNPSKRNVHVPPDANKPGKRQSKSVASSPVKPVAKARNQAMEQLRALHAHLNKSAMARQATAPTATREPPVGDGSRIDADNTSPAPETRRSDFATASEADDAPASIHPPPSGPSTDKDSAPAPSSTRTGTEGASTYRGDQGTVTIDTAQRRIDPRDGLVPPACETSPVGETETAKMKTQAPPAQPQGKRRRASTILGPEERSSQLINRQARSNMAHRNVSVLPPSAFPTKSEIAADRRLKASAPRLKAWRRANGGQLTVSQFMHKADGQLNVTAPPDETMPGAAASTTHGAVGEDGNMTVMGASTVSGTETVQCTVEDVDEEMKSDSFEDIFDEPLFDTNGAPPLEPHFVDIKTELNVNEPQMSADGNCGWLPVHALKTRNAKMFYSTLDPTDRKEKQYMCEGTYAELINDVDHLVKTQSLNLPALMRQYELPATATDEEAQQLFAEH